MRNLLYTVANNEVTTANTPLPLGVVNRRYGCALNMTNANSIVVRKAGYYKVSPTVSMTNGTSGSLTETIQVTQNGSPVPGIESEYLLAAGDTVTSCWTGIIRVTSPNTLIQIVPLTSGITIGNLTVAITEV